MQQRPSADSLQRRLDFADFMTATPRTLIGQIVETPAHLKETENSSEQDENWPPRRPLKAGDPQRVPIATDVATDLKNTAVKLAENQRTIDALEAQRRELSRKLREENCISAELQKQVQDLRSENAKLAESESDLRQTVQEAEGLAARHEQARATLVRENAALSAELTALRNNLQRSKEAEIAKYKEKTSEVKERLRATQAAILEREKVSEEIEASHQKQVTEYERQQLREVEDAQHHALESRRRLEAATTELKRLEGELAAERQRSAREQAALKLRMETMGVAVPRYDVLPWILAFFVGVLVSYIPLWRLAGGVQSVG